MKILKQITEHDETITDSFDPFEKYPDFGKVLDQMAEKGLHLYYYRVRTVFRDEGIKWREEWENLIKNWMYKARYLDYISKILNDEDTLLLEYVNNIGAQHQDYEYTQIIMKIFKAVHAQKYLVELQKWLLLDAQLKHPPDFVKFLEGSLEEWKNSKRDVILTPFFEMAPKGTLERFKDVERVIDFIEKRTPIGKMDGLYVHPSEDFEFIRLCLRNILGLPTNVRNLWSDRDVKTIFQWTEMGKKLLGEASLSKSSL